MSSLMITPRAFGVTCKVHLFHRDTGQPLKTHSEGLLVSIQKTKQGVEIQGCSAQSVNDASIIELWEQQEDSSSRVIW